MLNSLKDIQHCYYINLEKRTDRRQHIEKQLRELKIPHKRFNAKENYFGFIGCSISHYQCIKQAKELGLPHILICEDDARWLNPTKFTEQINKFLSIHKDDWDVLILGGNNIGEYENVDDTCIRVKKCQTTTAYLVKEHYYDKLITNFKEGIDKLIQNPMLHKLYAIDKYWFRLQEIDRFFLLIPLTITQLVGFSDIEKRNTNYDIVMLNVDKRNIMNMLVSNREKDNIEIENSKNPTNTI